jgi:hypothetical protein
LFLQKIEKIELKKEDNSKNRKKTLFLNFIIIILLLFILYKINLLLKAQKKEILKLKIIICIILLSL